MLFNNIKESYYDFIVFSWMYYCNDIYCLQHYVLQKSIYILSDKYAILNSHYYTIQLILGLCNSFLLLIFYIAWYIFSKNEFLFIILTPIIFWGLNYILEFYSRKKGYIGAKEES